MSYEVTPRPETIERVKSIIKAEKEITITKLYKASNVYYPSLNTILDMLEKEGVIEVDRTESINSSGVAMKFTKVRYKK